MGIALANSLQFVPPSLRVIAALITHKKSLHYVVAQLHDKCAMGTSYVQLHACGYPEVKVASAKIGNGLTVSYTETQDEKWTRRGLVWVAELSCHSLCAFLDRICQGELSTYDWLEKIEKKHREWLDRIPSA